MDIENHFEIELLRTLDVETEPESEVILNLLQKTQDLDYVSSSGESSLHISARRNFVNSALILLEAGASVNVKGSSLLKHRTPLHICSRLQDGVEMARLLLKYGADMNAEDENKITPLHAASQCEAVENVLELLNNGAKVDAVSSDGGTPLISAFCCAFRDRLKENHTSRKIFLIMQTLLRAGADVNFGSGTGKTALHVAASKSLPHIIRFLVKNKAEVTVKNSDGCTPLHFAIFGLDKPVETIRELIESGANVNALDVKERSALDYAVICGNMEAAQELLRCDAHFKFYSSIKPLNKSVKEYAILSRGYDGPGIKNVIAIFKELIRYIFVNSPDSLESVRQELEEDVRVVLRLRKFSTPECNLVDFKDACATEADALSKRSCDCGQSNIWANFLGHQECGCDRSHAIRKFLFSGQPSNFDYCFFYKLSKAFLLETTLNQMSFSEFNLSGKRVLLNWPCMKEMERYVTFEDVAAFIQSQRSVMGASGLEEVLTFAKGKSPDKSSSEIKPPSPKKLRVS